MPKYMDSTGLLFLWGKLKEKLVLKEKGKGLSTEDYTTDEKNKLDSLHKIEIVDNLTSSDTNNALSANQGRILSSLINKTNGDMKKSVYDTNDNGKIDIAENAEMLQNHTASYFAVASDLNPIALSGSYNDLSDKPTIPTISTDIVADALSDDKASSPKAVKTYVSSNLIPITTSEIDIITA